MKHETIVKIYQSFRSMISFFLGFLMGWIALFLDEGKIVLVIICGIVAILHITNGILFSKLGEAEIELLFPVNIQDNLDASDMKIEDPED